MSDVTNFVPEPTIDEMLQWVERANIPLAEDYDDRIEVAIRAILEQHRNPVYAVLSTGSSILTIPAPNQLEAIRAFVERVDAQYMIARTNDLADVGYYRTCVIGELAAMEKEAE